MKGLPSPFVKLIIDIKKQFNTTGTVLFRVGWGTPFPLLHSLVQNKLLMIISIIIMMVIVVTTIPIIIKMVIVATTIPIIIKMFRQASPRMWWTAGAGCAGRSGQRSITLLLGCKHHHHHHHHHENLYHYHEKHLHPDILNIAKGTTDPGVDCFTE